MILAIILASILNIVLATVTVIIYILVTGVEDKLHLGVAFVFWPITFTYMVFKND